MSIVVLISIINSFLDSHFRKYGDLGATIAAVLLDPEARSINLDADPFKGNLREPILRMTALMRGMELEQAEGQSLVKMSDLDTKIGQQAHRYVIRYTISFLVFILIPFQLYSYPTLALNNALINKVSRLSSGELPCCQILKQIIF